METKRRTTAILSVVIAILAIAAGGLWYAHSGLKTEMAQLLEAQRTLGAEADTLKTETQSQRERIGALDTEVQSLKRSLEEQVAEAQRVDASAAESRQALDGAQAQPKQLQRSQQEAQRQLKSLAAEKTTLSQTLSEAREQAKDAAAAGATLSRELSSAQRTLEEARARSADLNKSYEKLLNEHSILAATDTARQMELARTKSAFEEAQTEVARLTGARGIYTVQNADSRSSIAAVFYRNGNRWSEIHKEDAFLGDKPDLIYAAQVLIIPK